MPTISTQHGLANLALGFVGARDFLASLTEESVEAQVASVYMPLAINGVLGRRCWRFATKRQLLALTTEDRDGWEFCYQAPADMVRPFEVWPGKRMPRSDERIPFALELNDAGDGLLICTDLDEALLKYTRQVALGLWPASFVEAVAWKLSGYLALAIPLKVQLGVNLVQKAEAAYLAAAAEDLQNAQEDVAPDSEFFTVRQ